MPIDRVQPVKIESTDLGGSDVDEGYVPVNPNQDAPEVRGLYLQNDTSRDTSASVIRDNSNNLTLTDPRVGGRRLSDMEVLGLLEQGPARAGYKEVVGGVFPTSVIWYVDSTKALKILEKTITRNANMTPSQVAWKVYGQDGTTVLATVTDVISYNGVFETTRTRTIS